MVAIKTNWADNSNQWVDAAYLNGLGTQVNTNSTNISQLSTTVSSHTSTLATLATAITRITYTLNTSSILGAAANVDYIFFLASGAAPIMPTAVGNASRYTLKNTSTSSITVSTTSSQTIDGTTTISIKPGDSVDLISNGSAWFVI